MCTCRINYHMPKCGGNCHRQTGSLKSFFMTCTGLQEALKEPVSADELDEDVNSEVKANTPESWKLIQSANTVLEEASKEVTDGTDRDYRRWVSITVYISC